ncbi:MAG: hydroxymethylglutaryl-CoA lyase [Bdellovibrionaceae bacterium]|nr:hydroxymethylglutaryl-CoA lyase [Pseudobdellovibrionaceae bacterium]
MSKKSVQIVEVGLRDGLQNEKATVSVPERIELAKRLAEAGSKRMELGAFVRADWVPQMAGSKEVIDGVFALVRGKSMPSKIEFSALVPNERGLEMALETGIKEIAVFGAASETFSKKNINCTIEESFEKFAAVIKVAKKKKIKVRGYLSCCFGCPFEGDIDEKKVVELTKRLIKMGCYEVSIGDTIGIAHPGQVKSLFAKLKRAVPVKKLAGHFHDTRGTALVNILTAYEMGVRVFDSSLGGLGGCPYAPGSAGNVATEEVVFMFEGMGVSTGLDLELLIEANHWMSGVMKKELTSRLSKAGLPVAGPV